jgi:phage shock protein PspC (stress-responsive transcriptional regulator)
MRNREQGVLGGVAAGFGDYLDVDPVLVRLVFIFLTFMHGLGLLLYVACWVSMPAVRRDAAEASTPAEAGEEAVGEAAEAPVAEPPPRTLPPPSPSPGRGRLVIGSILVFVGTVGLLERLSWLDWLDWERLADLWPMVLIAMGVALIVRSREARGVRA